MTSHSHNQSASQNLITRIKKLVIEGDNESLTAVIRNGLLQGVSATEMLYRGMIPAMDQIGKQFKQNLIFIPEVLLSARAMNEGLELLEPQLTKKEKSCHCKAVIGTVFGDMHDIGKNLVGIMLKGAGFEVVDLGFNVPVERFIEEAKSIKPELICLSSLLTTAMPEMKTVIDGLIQAGIRSEIKIMVGGAPVSQRFADNIGADGYADNAVLAVDLAKQLVDLKRSP
ncbi:MAG: corrinoid protein [Proteobacteria bacterium]|nr:corrinoid protein [Pseudomonadota bacterium]